MSGNGCTKTVSGNGCTKAVSGNGCTKAVSDMLVIYSYFIIIIIIIISYCASEVAFVAINMPLDRGSVRNLLACCNSCLW